MFGEIRPSGEPTRRHRWRYKVGLFSEAAFIFKFRFPVWAVRSSMCVLFMPLQLSWQPTPFCPLHVALVASSRVAFSVRYVLIHKWRVVQGLARRLSNKVTTLVGSLITKASGVCDSFISHWFLWGAATCKKRVVLPSYAADTNVRHVRDTWDITFTFPFLHLFFRTAVLRGQ